MTHPWSVQYCYNGSVIKSRIWHELSQHVSLEEAIEYALKYADQIPSNEFRVMDSNTGSMVWYSEI